MLSTLTMAGPSDIDGPRYVEVGILNTDPVSEQEIGGFARFASAEQLEQYLIDDALDRYADLFGQPTYREYYLRSGTAVSLETNVQVAGVDEGDLVETDGEYIYTLSGDELVIFDSRAGEELRVASRVGIADRPSAMYLSGDRLTILSYPQQALFIREPMPWLPIIRPALTFDSASWLPSPRVVVTVLDVSDREAPALVQETELDGTYVDSRAIGDSVYLVLSHGFLLPRPDIAPGTDDGSDSREAILWGPLGDYETQEQYLARIEGQVSDLALPHVSSEGPDGAAIEPHLLSEATDIYLPLSPDGNSLISVVVFDASSDTLGPVSSTSVPSDYNSKVYVSTDSLYLLSANWSSGEEETAILKLDFNQAGESVDLSAVGTVPGHVLNQFSVDQYDGYLRIATTQRAGTSQNNVYVLQQEGDVLEIVGRLENLAPGETIYSTRFMEDRAFLVTYRMVDPLFALDMSNPTDPQVKGELKIPGFSNYLQSIGDGYLIGLGRHADEDTGLFQDPQVSLFNIDDLGNPELLDRFTLDTGRTGGMNLFSDHHAIAYFPEHQVLAISVPGYPEGQLYHSRLKNNLWVFKIDTDADTGTRRGAIELLGKIQHDTSVLRSVRIGELLYSISEDAVTAHDILNPQTQIDKLYYEPVSLGQLDFVELKDVDLSTGERWYRFSTRREGILTADALFERASGGDLQITLYDSDFNELATSIDDYPWSQARLDWDTDAGTEYYLEVSGTARDVDLRLANLVQVSEEHYPRSLQVYGTNRNDTFEFEVGWQTHGGDPWSGDYWTTSITQRQAITVNGVRYDFARLVSQSVTIHGMGGSDTATVDITHLNDMLPPSEKGSIVAELHPGSGTITHTGPIFGRDANGTPQTFALELDSVTSITVRGGNEAHLFDSIGDDRFVATPRYGGMSGPGFSNHVLDFESVLAHATVAHRSDTAKFYDSPGDDLYVTTPTYAGLSGEGFERHALGFDAAHAYATAGGFDVAKMFDSPADDHFYADPIQGVLYGDGFLKRAKFFEQVHAYATAGGHDVADLFDSPEDDLFFGNSVEAALWGTRFYNRAKHFEEVQAHGTYSGNDRAYLLDSPAADHVAAQADWTRISSSDLSYLRQVTAFDHVRATSTAGRNTKQIDAVDFMLTLEGEWTDP